MKKRTKNNGAVFLIIVFAIALITTITVGIMIMSTEELQLMQNQLYAVEAMCTAEAGLNDAFKRIRTSPVEASFNETFNGGTYSVGIVGTPPTQINSEGTSRQGYKARISADVTVSSSSPHIIRVNKLRINE